MDRTRQIVAKSRATAERQSDELEMQIDLIDDSIASLSERRHQAEATKREFDLISDLSGRDAAEAWETLPKRRRYEKDILLAVFSNKETKLPEELEPGNWESNAPEDIKEDRDILIALASATSDDDPEDTTINVPEKLLGDFEVIEAVAKPCPHVLMQDGINPRMFHSDAVFRAFAYHRRPGDFNEPWRHSEFLSSMDTILGKFSCRIRSNAEHMLQAFTAGLNVFPHISRGLRSDKGFCLKLLGKENRVPSDALQHFSRSLRSDREVVLVAVQRNGLTLKDAAERLRQNLDIVRAASANDATAFFHCGGMARNILARDKTFMKNLMSKRPFRRRPCPDLYAMLTADLKLDLEMIVTARRSNCLDLSDLPKELAKDPQFWKHVLRECCLFWKDLPNAFKLDISFALCITGFDDVKVVKDVLNVHPCLASDAEFWCNAILSSSSDYADKDGNIAELIREIGSGVRNNRAVMLLACSRTSRLLQELPRDFMLDRQFVEVTVKNAKCYICDIPGEVQLLYPDLLALALTKSPEFDDDHCVAAVVPSLWSNTAVAEAWFRRAGYLHDIVYDCVPSRLRSDPDYCMIIAEHCDLEGADMFGRPILNRTRTSCCERSKRSRLLIYCPKEI